LGLFLFASIRIDATPIWDGRIDGPSTATNSSWAARYYLLVETKSSRVSSICGFKPVDITSQESVACGVNNFIAITPELKARMIDIVETLRNVSLFKSGDNLVVVDIYIENGRLWVSEIIPLLKR
jgi:hypothetical protein